MDCAHVETLAEAVQDAIGDQGDVALVDQGYTGAPAAEAYGIALEVVKLLGARKGFVLLPRLWAVKRNFAWASRFRRLVRDVERLPGTGAGLHLVPFTCLMLHRWLTLAAQSP